MVQLCRGKIETRTPESTLPVTRTQLLLKPSKNLMDWAVRRRSPKRLGALDVLHIPVFVHWRKKDGWLVEKLAILSYGK